MKKLNPILLTILILISFSCSNKWHIGTGNVKNNLTQWKADKEEKKAAKIDLKKNVAKY